MIATDLDGTLLGDARVIDERDWAGLAQLGRSGIVRVIASAEDGAMRLSERVGLALRASWAGGGKYLPTGSG